MFCLRRLQLSATTATDCNPCRSKDEDCAVFLNLDRDLKRQSETLRGAIGSDVVYIKGYEETPLRHAKQIPVAARQRSDLDMPSCNHVGPAIPWLNFTGGDITRSVTSISITRYQKDIS
jgi:hypothetical protein